MSSNIFDLKGKVALITGGNSGIGLGFASGLAKAGADVVIWGRREANNRAAERALQLHGGRVASRVVDVAAETEVIEGMRAAVAEMGRLDCVVANAGLATQAPFTEMTAEVYHALLDVNLHGAFYTLREAAKHMVARAKAGDAGGSLILCGSGSIFQGVPTMAHYGMAKGALNSLAKALAAELGPHGIRANVIAPGFIITEMTQADPVLGEGCGQGAAGASRAARRSGRSRRLFGQRRFALSYRRHAGDRWRQDGGELTCLPYPMPVIAR
jgi:NAD(P)-dependent dehydrogenase (short-subunit alcohol dehydrogenase family)